MKKKLQTLSQRFIVILAIFCCNISLAQIPNLDMENWTPFTFDLPSQWVTFGATSKISPGESGLYAVKLQAMASSQSSEPGGVLYGNVNNDQFLGGTPFAARPDSMIAYFNYSIEAGDSAWVIILMKKNGDAISNDLYKYTGSFTSGFERKAFKINYTSVDIPDTVFIAFTSTIPDIDTVNANSYVILDNISFTGTSTNVPNPDFEDLWTSQTNYTLNGWDSRIRSGATEVERTTDKYAGNYAMKLQTIFESNGDTLRGYTQTSMLNNNTNWGPAFPVNSRPDSLKGFYKFIPQNVDTFTIAIGLFKNGVEVGNGFFSSPGAIGSYTPFSAPIFYNSFPTGNPDSAFIQIATFATNEYNFGPRGQSVAFIDSLSFANTVVVVPVNFIGFTVTKKDNTAILNWQIENESALTDRYEVERSLNSADFKKIVTIAPKNNGSSANSYHSTDVDLSSIRSSGVIYYRIKQIDKDGRFIYTEIKTVSLDGKGFSATIYPNPVNGNTIVLQMNLQKGSYTITLTNILGQQIMNKMIEHAGDSATETIEPSKALAAGVYQLRLTGGGINITRQVIKN